MQSYMRDGRIRECDESTKVWHATSSLRSVYREDADFMLKFSISLRLTNSIRHLLFHEVERGQQLHDVLATPTGQRFLREHPSFQMMSEPAFVAFKDEQGLPLSESIVVCRENPFQNTVARNKVVLATLTQDHPFGGLNLIQRLILSSTVEANQSLRTRARLWFDGFLKASVAPILAAHANYGIVLGAHQQNLILDLQNGYPVGSFFRDCQGTGYTELGWSLFAEDVPLLSKGNGNILGEDMGNWLLSYYVILNSTFNVITALSQNDWIQEEELLADLKDCLGRLLAKGVRDESCLRYLLYEKKGLMHKGNFLCSFKNMNENTIDDPLAIYTRVPNPLAPFERRNHA